MAATAGFLSFNISKLELFSNGISLGTATGFFLKQNTQWYLITNWHVLSGRFPTNGQPRHWSLAVPDQCKFIFYELQGEKLAPHVVTYELNHPIDGSALWFQHPKYGQQVDIAALPLDPRHVGKAKDLLEPGGHDPSMLIDLGQEIFIPGFPLGFAGDGFMAIWKRASVASSLEIGDGINLKFYVDTATREGMSGSPCIAIANWKYYSLDRSTGKVTVVDRPLSWRLLGVYSGRLNPSDSFEAQIGLVWRENLIEELISSMASGSYELLS
ncbi:trypsin-like peptidase domain-containing protein [Pseudomonas koreensis]|uniref:trypsin-like peptidase domain-containing protein n=1 Tax=Pseudomonas koreensis TaxID=198620 RepID=UPI003018BE6B